MDDRNVTHIVLQRLTEHFGSRVRRGAAATTDDLEHLRNVAGSLPTDLEEFFRICNGLQIQCTASEPLVLVWDSHHIAGMLLDGDRPTPRSGFIPLRDCGNGEFDWLITGGWPARLAVIRWDPTRSHAILLNSRFSAFLKCWMEFLTAHYDTEGSIGIDGPSSYDASFTCQVDEGVARLMERDDVKAWLGAMDPEVVPIVRD